MKFSFDQAQLTLAAIWYGVFLFSTVLHEASHAFFAMRLGDQTAYRGGQVTLNPIPHMKREPIGLIVIPIITFFASGWMMGWASVPYNVGWAMRYPKRNALMSLAGPLANITLMAIAGIAIHVGINMGVFKVPDYVSFDTVAQVAKGSGPKMLATVLSIVFSLNLILAIFNLLPVPGLDGSATPLLFLGKSAAQKFMKLMNARYSMIIFIAAWYLFDKIYRPILSFMLDLIYP